VINLRRGDDETVARKPHGRAQSRRGQLKNVRVEKDARIRAFRARLREEGARRLSVGHRDVNVFGGDDHVRSPFARVRAEERKEEDG
jgi:hypothetical protein